jgi:hypothetical protein
MVNEIIAHMRKSFGPKPCPMERNAGNERVNNNNREEDKDESKKQPDIITSEDGQIFDSTISVDKKHAYK